MAKGFTQIEGLDYDETFAPISRLEAIIIFLSYAAHKGFKVYQMDVKSAFLNGELDTEVYLQQPPNFFSIPHIRTTATNSEKLFIASSKLLTPGTRLSLTSSCVVVFEEVFSILRCSERQMENIS